MTDMDIEICLCDADFIRYSQTWLQNNGFKGGFRWSCKLKLLWRSLNSFKMASASEASKKIEANFDGWSEATLEASMKPHFKAMFDCTYHSKYNTAVLLPSGPQACYLFGNNFHGYRFRRISWLPLTRHKWQNKFTVTIYPGFTVKSCHNALH